MCGSVRTILKNPSNAMRNNLPYDYNIYVSNLLQNTLDLGWHLAKVSSEVLMTEMENSSLDLTDLI